MGRRITFIRFKDLPDPSDSQMAGMSSTRIKSLVAAAAAALALAALAGPADGAMRTSKINKNLCETTGGGKFVPIPASPARRSTGDC